MPGQNKRITRRKFAYKDKCLLFVNEKATWSEARSYCQGVSGVSGNLVTIPDNETMNFIINKLDSSLRWDVGNVWIGFSYSNGGWKWVTGMVMDYKFQPL